MGPDCLSRGWHLRCANSLCLCSPVCRDPLLANQNMAPLSNWFGCFVCIQFQLQLLRETTERIVARMYFADRDTSDPTNTINDGLCACGLCLESNPVQACRHLLLRKSGSSLCGLFSGYIAGDLWNLTILRLLLYLCRLQRRLRGPRKTLAIVWLDSITRSLFVFCPHAVRCLRVSRALDWTKAWFY